MRDGIGERRERRGWEGENRKERERIGKRGREGWGESGRIERDGIGESGREERE